MNDPLVLLSRDISNDRFVGFLYFEDRLNGEFRTVYLNEGASGAQVIELLSNPARQFDPPPPPPAPPLLGSEVQLTGPYPPSGPDEVASVNAGAHPLASPETQP